MKLIAVIIFSISIAGCSFLGNSYEISSVKPDLTQEQKSIWYKLLGRWQSEQMTKEGVKRKTVSTRYSDGTYEVKFISTYKDGTTNTNIEAGYWGVSGYIYFSIYEGNIVSGEFVRTNPNNPYRYDAYHIIKLTDALFEYHHVNTGNKYVSEKIKVIKTDKPLI